MKVECVLFWLLSQTNFFSFLWLSFAFSYYKKENQNEADYPVNSIRLKFNREQYF